MVWDLAAGQPSTAAPEPVRRAAHASLDEHILGYTEAPGIEPLRRAIATHYRDRYDLAVDTDDGLVVSAGGRVLSVVGTGADLAQARENAYALVNSVHLRGSHYRTDIALAAAEGRVHVPGTA